MDEENVSYIFIYGTLMKGYKSHKKFNLSKRLNYIGIGKLNGIIYDIGEYPGLVIDCDDEKTVNGEVYEILDQSVLQELDEFESYKPSDPEDSLYVRTSVQLIDPKIEAWTYTYNNCINDKKKIKEGCWRSYEGSN